MSTHDSEEEQIEMIKEWWRSYGLVTVLAIVLGVGGSFSWQYWKKYQLQQQQQASMLYQQLLSDLKAKDAGKVGAVADKIIADYRRTPYAGYAALIQAQQAVKNNQFPGALKKLLWVIDHSGNKAIVTIAKIRAARVQLAMNKPDQALQLLDAVDNKNFTALVESVRGDVFFMKGNRAKAKQAYQSAVNHLPPAAPLEGLIRMKLAQLADNSNTVATQSTKAAQRPVTLNHKTHNRG